MQSAERARKRVLLWSGLEGDDKRCRRLVSIFGPLGEKTLDHTRQSGRSARRQRQQRGRLLIKNVRHGLKRGGASKWQPPRCHLVDDHAKRKQIASWVDRALRNAFGGH